jgi:AraC-like DNA-binding protein
MTEIFFTTCQPPPSLLGAVQELWILKDDGRFHAGLPKPFVEIVVSLTGIHWWRSSRASGEHRYAEAWVTPIQDGPRYARAVGTRTLIGARLSPWAAVALFGQLPRGDGFPPPYLSSFIGREASQLRRCLLAADNNSDRFALFIKWLEGQSVLLQFSQSQNPSPESASRARNLAVTMKLSPRALRRRFAADVGISPKRWLTLRRIDAVLRDRSLLEPNVSLAGIAHEHGYADQAHFSREVGRLTGATPGQLRKRPRNGPPHLLPGD